VTEQSTLEERCRSLRRSLVRGIATPFSAAARQHVAAVAGLLVLLPVGAVTATTILKNGPGTLPDALSPISTSGPTASHLAGVVAALTLAAASDRPTEQLGLLFVGVFGALVAISPAATLPAAVAVVGGAALAVGPSWNTRRGPFVALYLLALATSFAGSLGVETATLRPVGSTLAVLGLGTTALAGSPRLPDWLVGGLVTAFVLFVGTSAPYVTGAVVLVGFAVLGTPLVLVAAGSGFATAAVVDALRRDRRHVALGVAILVATGVPATIGHAVAVVVGLRLVSDSEVAE
jgi:hypothetical protein